MGAIAAYAEYSMPSPAQVFAGVFIVVILLIPLLFWFGYCGLQVMRSIRRFSDRGSVRTR